MGYQQKYKALNKMVKTNSRYYSIKTFHGADKKYSLICFNDKIVIPNELQKGPVEWYHSMLSHPGETRTELAISQHFYWKSLRKTVHHICTKHESCQLLKCNKKHMERTYGKLLPKQTGRSCAMGHTMYRSN